MSPLLHCDEFRTLLARYLAIDVERITPTTDLLHELGLDALDLVLLSVRIEEIADVEMPIAAIARVRTVADFLNAFQPTRAPVSSQRIQARDPERDARQHDSWSTIRAVRPCGRFGTGT